MNTELRSLAKEYIENVDKVCLLMLEGLNLKTKSDLWDYRSLHHLFELNFNGNKYVFHGRGCRFSNKDTIIDWDFGYGSRWCGIGPWFLSYYIKENHKELSDLYNSNMIQKEFEEAVISGEMVSKYDLYYFTIPASEMYEPDFPKCFDTLIIEHYDSQWIIKRNKKVDKFIRKSRRVSKHIGENHDVYTLNFILNDVVIYSIAFDDIGYPERALILLNELMKENKEEPKQ